MTNTYEHELRVATDAVRAAARVCRAVQATITPATLEKKDRSPVTVADFASQAVVCRAISEAFPNDPIIGEEDAAELRAADGSVFLDKVVAEIAAIDIPATAETVCDWIDRGSAKEYSDRFWTLDPIDGTKGFLRGEQYAVSLALIVNGRIDVALLACPNLPPTEGGTGGTLCTAVRGSGSHSGPLDPPGELAPAHVTTTTDASTARFCESVESGHSSHGRAGQVATALGITRPSVRLDSQAKYAVVGRGDADIYMRLPARPGYVEKIWDHAGGVLFVEEAGGRVTDVFGKPLEFTHGFELSANRGVIVTNGPLHEELLQALQKTYET